MAGRYERCSGCGVQLLLSTVAQTMVQCPVCKAITRVRPANPLLQTTPFNTVNPTSISLSSYTGSSGYGYGYGYGCGYGYGYYPKAQPMPPPPAPAQYFMPPSAHRSKRAVLIGIDYVGRSNQLQGGINDVKNIRFLLAGRMGFPTDSIRVLTEYETDPFRIPTKQNIRMAMQWLVQDCQPGDSLVFYFTGHGMRQPDYDMDEADGYDEALCPVDYETQGPILDDEVNATIVRPLPQGTTLHALIDACHSATMLDLPFLCRMNREGYYVWEDHTNQLHYKGTNGGIAVCISGCDDDQSSERSNALSGYTNTSVMTYSFIQVVQNEPGLTYGRLLNAMRSIICQAPTAIFRNGYGLPYKQTPQISTSTIFNIHMKPFIL